MTEEIEDLNDARIEAHRILASDEVEAFILVVSGNATRGAIGWMGNNLQEASTLVGQLELEMHRHKGSIARQMEQAEMENDLFNEEKE